TVDGNAVVLQANGNVASNSTTLSGQQMGAVGSELSTSGGNTQSNSGSQTATLSSDRVGVVVGSTSAVGLSNLSGGSVSSNALRAMTYANSAINANNTTASNTAYLGTMSTTNSQTNTAAGTGSSSITGATVGFDIGNSVTSITGSALSVNANALTAASYGNGADNTISVNAQTVTGISSSGAYTTLGSTQDNSGSMTALIGSTTRVGVFTGTATTGITGSQLSVDGNQLQALTYANNATNVNAVKASNNAYLGALGTTNTQSNVASGSGSSAITSTTVGVSIGAASSTALGTSPTSVSSNDLMAASYGNYASNATSASGGNTLYGSGATQELSTGNVQTNYGAMTASGSTLLVGVLTSTAATGVSNSALTVDANTVKAEAKGNIASNSTSITAQQTDSTTALSALSDNSQGNLAALSATLGSTTRVGVFTGATTLESVTDSALSVSHNQLAALTQANSATNATTVATSNTADLGALATTNAQTNTSAGTGASTVTGATVGVSLGAVNGTAVIALDASPTSVSSNTLSAASYGNGASNTLTVTAQLAGISARPLGDTLTSTQNNSGSQTALMSSTNVGVLTSTSTGSTSATGINASALTVSNNTLEAMAYANSAANINSVTAANSAYLGALLTSNTQNNGGLGSGSSTISATTLGVSLGGETTLGLNNSPTSVLSNTLIAASYGNYATSATNASGGNVLYGSNNATVDLKTDNIQTNAATMSASGSTITIGVLASGTTGTGISGSSVTVGSNAVSALSYGNQAGNSVSATAGDAIYGSGSTTALVQSVQSNSGATASSLATVKVGVFTTNTGTDVSGSAVTVDGNRLTAASYSNSAVNSLSLNAPIIGASGTVVTGQVSNSQSNTASGSGTITDATVGIVPSTGVTGALALNGVTGMVGNNALNAQAGGNTAINALNATAVASIAGNGTTTPNFQVLNYQNNSSAGVMTASVTTGTIGNWGSNSSNYYGPSTLTVSLNGASANAYGNSASNSLNMSALTGSSNAATVALGNSQSNAAALSATVTSTVIGIGNGQGTGTVAISGNSITANTVGNAVSNSIGIKR
ncbi:MAG: beta strand repeat-containing protein, partial [Rhodoferax sp.]